MGHSVGSAEWNDSQGCISSGNALQYIVNGTVPSAGNNRVETVANRHAYLRSRIGSGSGGCDFNFNSCCTKDLSCRLHVLHSLLFSTAGMWVVEEGGFAHG